MVKIKSNFQKIVIIFFILNIIAIFYFSWVPKPNMTGVNWLPSQFAQFLDILAIKDIRTSFPFFTLGLFLNLYKINPKYNYLKYLFPFAIVVIAEVVQLFLPQRVFTFADILWAMVGTIFGLFAGWLIRIVWLKKKPNQIEKTSKFIN